MPNRANSTMAKKQNESIIRVRPLMTAIEELVRSRLSIFTFFIHLQLALTSR